MAGGDDFVAAMRGFTIVDVWIGSDVAVRGVRHFRWFGDDDVSGRIAGNEFTGVDESASCIVLRRTLRRLGFGVFRDPLGRITSGGSRSGGTFPRRDGGGAAEV